MSPTRPSAPLIRSHTKILSPAQLLARLRRLRSQHGRARVVFTNGCFDLLHAGHVRYLEQARRLGTHLIVALNDDASVRRLKGADRPVNELADRAEVMSGLAAVDFVTWFADDTPLALILKLRPDVLCKGGDYEADSIVGASEVRSWKGRVKILPFVAGRSTTAILVRAKKRD